MLDIITSYEDLINYMKNMNIAGKESLFWIIEYDSKDEIEKYSLFRNECLKHPQDFKDRLDQGIYKIWTCIPY